MTDYYVTDIISSEDVNRGTFYENNLLMWNAMLTKLLHNFIKIQKPQVYKHWGISAIAVRMNSTEDINTDLFSQEDKDKILNIINSKSIEDILQYSITKRRAQILESHRENNGPYTSLEDLLQIKGMNDKCLFRFYKSIICGKKIFPKKITRGLIITPKDTGDSQKEVDTVLGIHIGQDMISWSLLNRDCEVLQWSYKSFPKDRRKENLHSLLEITLPITAKLPKADRYVMQETGGDMGYQQSRKFYHTYVEQSVIGGIIMSYLTTSHCKVGNTTDFIANNIFILRQHTLRKIYGLIVGNEAISTQYMLQKLLQESDDLTESKERLPSVILSTELREMYNAHSPVYQEQISWSLLIALAFLELVVHERVDMIVRSAV